MNMQPAISVVMPVYNAAAFLEEAIKSVLSQTFTNFECIIINDGSTDNTEEIIRSFSDPRLRYLANSKNEGLIYSLNRGVEEARGKYIARMDGDDISVEDRFRVQFDYLEEHPLVCVLAVISLLVNKEGKDLGYWKEDRINIDSKSIRKSLPKNNCISHPSIMMKTDLLKKYRYDSSQPLSEDYDLWLRLSADGVNIAKLPLPLIKHRILDDSFTRSRNTNVFFKLMRLKYKFVRNRFEENKINSFVVKVFLFAILDFFKGLLKISKKKIVKL